MKKLYFVVGALALCLSTSIFSGGGGGGISTYCDGGCDGSAPNKDGTTKPCGWGTTIITAPDRGIFSLDGFDSCTSPTLYDCSDPIPTNIKNPGILTCTAHGTGYTYTFSCSNSKAAISSKGTVPGKAGTWCHQIDDYGHTQEIDYICKVDNSGTPNAYCYFGIPPK